jgi:hypothetical protein
MPKPAVRDTGGRADIDRYPSLTHFIDDRVRRGHTDLPWPAALAGRVPAGPLNLSDEADSRAVGASRTTRTEARSHRDPYHDKQDALSLSY